MGYGLHCESIIFPEVQITISLIYIFCNHD